MKKIIVVVVCLLFSETVLSRERENICYLYQAEVALKKSMRHQIQELDQEVERKLMDERCSITDRYYYHGYQHWRQGNYRGARNSWHKYLHSIDVRMADHDDRRKQEVTEYFEWITPLFEHGDKKPRKVFVAKKKKEIKKKFKPVVSAGTLVKRAQIAKHHGHFERALQIYQMALKLEPSSQKILSAIHMLEREMN